MTEVLVASAASVSGEVTTAPVQLVAVGAGTLSDRAAFQLAIGKRRIYRKRSKSSGVDYFWGNFRSKRFRPVGGKRVALRERDSLVATTSLERAIDLYDEMKARLEAKLLVRDPSKLGKDPELAAMAQYHLLRKKLMETVTAGSLKNERDGLRWAVRLMKNPPLSLMNVPMLEDYVRDRRASAGPGKEPISDTTIGRELDALSSMFKSAIAIDLVPNNPVARMPNKPKASHVEVTWLSPEGLALLLDAAAEEDAAVADARAEVDAYKAYKQRRAQLQERGWRAEAIATAVGEVPTPSVETFARARCLGCMELICTNWAYTGLRHGELRGSYIQDYDLEFGLVSVRPRHDRSLKRWWTAREVQLPPAATLVLRRYLADTGLTSGPLIPDARGRVRGSLAKSFRRVVMRAGLSPDEVTPQTLRHTFASLRFQTVEPVEGGDPVRVTLDDVAAILGQRSTQLLKRVYLHARGRLRLRTSVEVEDLRATPAERLRESLPPLMPQPKRRPLIFKAW